LKELNSYDYPMIPPVNRGPFDDDNDEFRAFFFKPTDGNRNLMLAVMDDRYVRNYKIADFNRFELWYNFRFTTICNSDL
jgi:hypothetical protein